LLAVQLFDYFQANMSAMGLAGGIVRRRAVVDIIEINQ